MTMWIYKTNSNNTAMYTLGTYGENTIICMGTTPNTAQPAHLDAATRSVEGIAAYNGYDSWLMINVYAKRDSFFDNHARKGDHKIHIDNIATIREILEQNKEKEIVPIWAAFGEQIYKKDFLLPYLKDIYGLTLEYPNVHWYCSGTSRHGIPKNPLFLSSNTKLQELDMDSLIRIM